jgi:hypothetical protein
MALAAANYCTVCYLPCDLNTSVCPWCASKAVNFAGGLHTSLDYVPANVGYFLNALEHIDWADCLHLVIGPFRAAALLSPYMKTRVTAWQGKNKANDMKHLRVVTLENRGGWGVGAWGPIRGLANFWPDNIKLASGSTPKLIGQKETESGTIYAFEQSFVHSWINPEILVMGNLGVDNWGPLAVERHKLVFEKKLTRHQFDELYDRFGCLDFPLQQHHRYDDKSSLLKSVNGRPSLLINGYRYS